MLRQSATTILIFLAWPIAAAEQGYSQEHSRESRLKAEGAVALAQAARAEGDAVRGAIIFHQTQAMCVKCHLVDDAVANTKRAIGPDLTALPRETTDEFLIESLLEPSKAIRKGYELVTVATADGRSLAGLIVEQTDQRLVLRDPAYPEKTVALARTEIENQTISAISAMPAGLINQFASRQQFLDLVCYLIEIRDGGRARAAALMPPPALTALQIPEYEAHVDHTGLIRELDAAAYRRGKAIYERLCINCHGTRDQAGSLPTALRFAEGHFKNGSDPLTIYQTLTRGFGLMAPQSWMVPQQKYDVIHYVREEYLKPHNPSQYFAITDEYLASLPRGDTRGPLPRTIEPWVTMDYGPSLINTYEIGTDGQNIAQKGIAVRLDAGAGGVSRGRAWMVFEHDTLRWAAGWTGSGFIDWNGIHFNGKHQVHPRIVGDLGFQNPTGPGWANPENRSLTDDQRVVGRDGRSYGPLPRRWGRFNGIYHYVSNAVIRYTVGSTGVLESPGIIEQEAPLPPIFTRTLQLGPRSEDLVLVVASAPEDTSRIQPDGNSVQFGSTLAGTLSSTNGFTWMTANRQLRLKVSAGEQSLRLNLWTTREHDGQTVEAVEATVRAAGLNPDLTKLTRGGPARWPQKLTTRAVHGGADGPFAVDVLTHPEQNPWLAQMRFTGLDFLQDGDSLVACSWDGDVWRVSGLSHLDDATDSRELTWQRIASGLFQPLGIKVVNGQVFVTCRDQLVKLHDLNGDGETDFYECFNSDHQVTEPFHEFAMGLQTDTQGNFYYAKSARHALPAIVPHHGTLLRVSADGSRTDILATGFRAANGVCLNDDGTFVVTDQEGHWNPKNRINWVVPGKFYGNMFGYHNVTDSSDEAMEQPLCWITNAFDRSPGELLWVPQGMWGPLAGKLLNLSYGNGKLFVVPFEDVQGHKQGGMCALPIAPLPTGVMRGRFRSQDQQLYCCGMFAWAGSATQPGGLYRIRYAGRPMHLPIGLAARRGQIELTFTDPLDPTAACDAANYSIKTWSLKRTERYGSDHNNEQPLAVERADISPDGRTVTLRISKLQPTWGMEIACRLVGNDGITHQRIIHNSIFRFGE